MTSIEEQQLLEYLRTRSVLIASPMYRSGHWDYANSTAELRLALERTGVRHRYFPVRGLLAHQARNLIAAEFMAGDFDSVLMVDDDLGFQPEDALRLIT